MRVEAELVQNKLVIWDPKKGTKIYKLGFFGKPIGVPKPREVEEFETPLVLDPLEGLYLVEKGKIVVVRGPRKKPLALTGLRRWIKKVYVDFEIKYAVYKDLREKGYVVLPGVKYGSDFIVYERGPGLEHAPFMVQVKRSREFLTASEIVRSGRLATTVRKRFIVAMIDAKRRIKYLMFKWWRA
ncbi:MAG: tRNA-intron lyase [Candidatus Bathyarchaeia archaeon]